MAEKNPLVGYALAQLRSADTLQVKCYGHGIVWKEWETGLPRFRCAAEKRGWLFLDEGTRASLPGNVDARNANDGFADSWIAFVRHGD